jgi:hypothetical protein
MKRRLTRITGGLLAAAALVWACSDGGTAPNPVPTTIELNKTAVSFNAFGATDQLTATVKDQNGSPLSGQTVNWSSNATSVATVASDGLVTSVGNGSATITASVGSASTTAAVTVQQLPGEVLKPGGDAQTAGVTQTLADSLVAQINDAEGNAMGGITVNFAVSANGGSVLPTSGTTDPSGQVKTEWTFGTVSGTHTVTVTPTTGSGSAMFSATANPDVADTLSLVSGDTQSQQINNPLPDSVVMRVSDQYGNPVSGHQVDFVVTSVDGGMPSPASVSTAANGQAATEWTMGNTPGPHTMEARSSQGGSPLVASPWVIGSTALSPNPGSVEMSEGDNQQGLVGFAVNVAPAVLVRDLVGTPFPGAEVTFAVQTGGGTVTKAMDKTDASGIAQVGSWVLGSGITNNPITFTAMGVNSSYDIEITFLGSNWTPTDTAKFTAAKDMWETLIIGDLASIDFSSSPIDSACGQPIPRLDGVVDDLQLYAVLDSIDGPLGVLGSAGPCFIRLSNWLPVVGFMRFDSADVGLSVIDRVILHEMAHAIGVGTVWDSIPVGCVTNCLLQNPSQPSSPGVDTHFDGPRAIAEFDALGGDDYVGGEKVPVENTAVAGQADGHWRETVLGTELMTPFIGSTTDPLSRLTTAALWDVGYQVNLAASESFTVPAPPAMAGFLRIDLGDDILRGPVYAVDPSGRVVRRIR